MKTAIITICDNNNYGNRLQNFALQEVLKKILDDEVITIWNEENSISTVEKIKTNIKKIIKIIMGDKKMLREYNFNNFTKQYINNSEKVFTNSKNIVDKYDQYVIGSDQIWNYTFRGDNFGFFEFALFSNANKKNIISYAASFGISSIPSFIQNKYQNGLSNLNHISVREQAGAEIVKSLTKKEATVVLDPTLLLSKNEWIKMIKKPKQLKVEKFILTYFLGKISQKRKIQIEKIAAINGCKIINILDPNSDYYTCDPQEFLYLEKKAFLICTDSYHSSIFAILFERPFIVFEREDQHLKMNSRLDTLLDMLNLNNHKSIDEIPENYLDTDYSETFQILETEKNKSLYFLEKFLIKKKDEKL